MENTAARPFQGGKHRDFPIGNSRWKNGIQGGKTDHFPIGNSRWKNGFKVEKRISL